MLPTGHEFGGAAEVADRGEDIDSDGGLVLAGPEGSRLERSAARVARFAGQRGAECCGGERKGARAWLMHLVCFRRRI